MYCAVYICSTPWLLSGNELIHILEHELKENKRTEITGVSIYNEGSFFHYIEGTKSSLEYKEKMISRSLVYHGVIDLFLGEIKSRRFEDWHIGFLKPSDTELLNHINNKWWNAASALSKHDRCDGLELLDIFCKNERRLMKNI
jgi:Sensors of blue-light using FAD